MGNISMKKAYGQSSKHICWVLLQRDVYFIHLKLLCSFTLHKKLSSEPCAIVQLLLDERFIRGVLSASMFSLTILVHLLYIRGFRFSELSSIGAYGDLGQIGLI